MATGVERGVVAGVIGGLIVATFGAWKDTLFEDFEMRKFIRSPIIGMFTGGTIGKIYPRLPAFPLLGTSVASERLIVEGWKAIGRKPPEKFSREGRDSGWLQVRLGVNK